METLLYIFLFLSLITSIITLKATKDIFNPTTITLIFWGGPIFFSSLRLSGLQDSAWADKTYLLLIYSLIAFIIVPGLFIIFSKVKIVKRIKEAEKLAEIVNPKLVIIFSMITILAYFLENYIAAKSFIPALASTSGIDVHTVSVSGLLIITRSFIPFTVMFLYLSYKNTKKKLLLILLCTVLALPITRLARFDIIMSLIPLLGIMFEFAKNKTKFFVKIIVISTLLAVGGSTLGEYRMTQGYKYDEVSYAQGIQFEGYSGPFDTFAVLYGYFALSVENLDRFIKANDNFKDYQYGAFFLRPLTVGIFKMNNIFEGYPMYEFINKYRDPLIGYATVHTALVDFSMDFGYNLSICIMLLFSFIGIWLYLESFRKINLRLYYLLYAQALAFLAFQNLFIEARLLYQLILAFVILRYSYGNYNRNLSYIKVEK